MALTASGEHKAQMPRLYQETQGTCAKQPMPQSKKPRDVSVHNSTHKRPRPTHIMGQRPRDRAPDTTSTTHPEKACHQKLSWAQQQAPWHCTACAGQRTVHGMTSL